MHTISCYGTYIDYNFVQNEVHINRTILPLILLSLTLNSLGSNCFKTNLTLNLIITNRCEFPHERLQIKKWILFGSKWFGLEIDETISDKVHEECDSGDTLRSVTANLC